MHSIKPRSARLLASVSLVAAIAIVCPVPSIGVLALHSGVALGQSCCAGGGAYQPARLKLHEDLLFGIDARVDGQLGTAFPDGSYHGVPSGDACSCSASSSWF